MSFHDHETEEYNKRFGVNQRIQDAKKHEPDEIKDDLIFLDRMLEFDMSDKEIKWVTHILTLPNAINHLVKYIQGRTGSAIAHYDNKFNKKMKLPKFNERS